LLLGNKKASSTKPRNLQVLAASSVRTYIWSVSIASTPTCNTSL